MKKLILITTISLSIFSCATHQEKVLDATWVSMKHSTPPSSKDKVVKVGPIQEEYCMDTWTSGTFGLMDEVVKKAEKERKIDYIKYPSFTHTVEKSCAQVTGEGYRLVE